MDNALGLNLEFWVTTATTWRRDSSVLDVLPSAGTSQPCCCASGVRAMGDNKDLVVPEGKLRRWQPFLCAFNFPTFNTWYVPHCYKSKIPFFKQRYKYFMTYLVISRHCCSFEWYAVWGHLPNSFLRVSYEELNKITVFKWWQWIYFNDLWSFLWL